MRLNYCHNSTNQLYILKNEIFAYFILCDYHTNRNDNISSSINDSKRVKVKGDRNEL